MLCGSIIICVCGVFFFFLRVLVYCDGPLLPLIQLFGLRIHSCFGLLAIPPWVLMWLVNLGVMSLFFNLRLNFVVGGPLMSAWGLGVSPLSPWRLLSPLLRGLPPLSLMSLVLRSLPCPRFAATSRMYAGFFPSPLFPPLG